LIDSRISTLKTQTLLNIVTQLLYYQGTGIQITLLAKLQNLKAAFFL